MYESVLILTVMLTDVIKWHWGPPASKMSNSRLSKRTGCQHAGYLYYSENPKLGHMKPATGPHAACGPRAGHSW